MTGFALTEPTEPLKVQNTTGRKPSMGVALQMVPVKDRCPAGDPQTVANTPAGGFGRRVTLTGERVAR